MASVNKLQERLKSIVISLKKTVECPVCLETVKTPFRLCVRGHGVCYQCTAKIEKCPLCQEPFTLENLVCVKSMLEALPRFCRYSEDGCEEVVEPGNDHEMFCGYRPIVCRERRCSIKVPVNQIMDHYKKQHSSTFICENETQSLIWEMDPDCEAHIYTPIFLFNNIFWVLEVNDVAEEQYKIYFQATPIGKLECDYFTRITFEKDDIIYTYTLKATALSSCESKFGWKEVTNEEINLSSQQFCMKIPQSQLSNFIDDDGMLRSSYFFFKL